MICLLPAALGAGTATARAAAWTAARTPAWARARAMVPALVDPPIGGNEARELARRELEKPIYHRDDPSALDRFIERLQRWIESMHRTVSGPTGAGGGGGIVALVVILLLLVAIIVLVLWWMHHHRNTASARSALLEAEPSTAAGHRSAAERHAEAGQWAEAIRERLRGLARDLEERAILDPRPGRTADELAAEAGRSLPDLAAGLTAGVRIFDDVWYGDRPGTREGYEQLTRLEEQVRRAKPRPLDEPVAPAGPPALGAGSAR